MTVTYTVGDTREVIKGIPDGSVDLIASSPPFLALRSYVPVDHESKGDEIGSERNPAEFIDMLLGLTAEWGRVLAPHGSIAIELGDTYSGSGGAGGDYNEGGLRDGQERFDGSQSRAYGTGSASRPPRSGRDRNRLSEVPGQGSGNWPRAKSLALIPQLYATSLAYGRNILRSGLTARQLLDFMERIEENLPDLSASELLTMARQWIPQAEAIQRAEFQPWLVRNVIVWHRPNPAVGALGDKVRPSTSYIVIATRSAKRWFDLTAVRTEGTEPGRTRQQGEKRSVLEPHRNGATLEQNPAGAPPLDAWFDQHDSDLAEATSYDGTHDTWTLTTQPSRLAHYAMWPAKLAERLILSMCPREVCDALVCKSCGHTHELRNSQLNTFAMGAEEQQLPVSPALQEDLRRVRDVLRGPQSVDVRQGVSVQAGDGEARDTLQLQGRSDQPQGLYPPVDAELSVGNDGEGLRAGASLRDGAAPGAPAREARTRASQERREGRQSAGESAGDDERDASRRGDLSELRSRLLDSLTCACGAQEFRVCGEPRRRVEGAAEYVTANGSRHNGNGWSSGVVDLLGAHSHKPDGNTIRTAPTLGWTDCGHNDYRPGLVLDPFAGSGTTLAVADLHGRDAIGVDFDARNKAIYPARYDEVKRALFGTQPELPGQGDLFAEVAG